MVAATNSCRITGNPEVILLRASHTLRALGAKSLCGCENYNLFGLALSCQFIRRHLFRSCQSIGSAYFHIGLYTCSFPVAFGHRIDGATEWHTNREVVASRHPSHRMSTPARSLANNGGAFCVFRSNVNSSPPEKVSCEVRTYTG